MGRTDDGHWDAVSGVVDERRRTGGETGVVVDEVSDVAEEAAGGVALLAVGEAGDAGDAVGVGGQRALLQALVLVKQVVVGQCLTEALAAADTGCVRVGAYPAAGYGGAEVGHDCLCLCVDDAVVGAGEL